MDVVLPVQKVLPFFAKSFSIYEQNDQVTNRIFSNMLRIQKLEVKCVSHEYFHYLLKDKAKEFIGDVDSCALLNLRTLEVLGVNNKGWLKLTSCNETKEVRRSDGRWPVWKSIMPQVPLQECTNKAPEIEYIENPHRIVQCLLIDHDTDFVIFVNPDLYLNIRTSLHDQQTDSYFVNAQDAFSKNKPVMYYPEIALSAIVSLVTSSYEFSFETVNKILQSYFEQPRYFVEGDVFGVSLKDFAYPLTCSVFYYNVPYIYFKVTELTEPKFRELDNRLIYKRGCFIVKDHTQLYAIDNAQSFRPPLLTKFVNSKYLTSFELKLNPGGLDKYYLELYNIINLSVSMNNVIKIGKVLLSGNRGCGKRTVAHCVADTFGLHVMELDCFDLFTQTHNYIEAKLSQVFNKLQKMAPSLLLVKNIELLGKDKDDAEDVRIISSFTSQLKRLESEVSDYPIVITAHTNNKPHAVLSQVRRLFVSQIEFKPPSDEEKCQMFDWLVRSKNFYSNSSEIYKLIVKRTAGFNFADVAQLVRHAIKHCILEKADNCLKLEHFEKGLASMESAYSDAIGAPKIPSVYWSDVGGLTELKDEIINTINFPLKYPHLAKTGLRRSGILLYGPPGTGKTLIAKAVATEFGLHFLSVKGPELMNMYVGQSEQNVREVFARARDSSPCIIFFDELDSLAPNRGRSGDSGGVSDRVVSQLLAEMDGLQKNVNLFIIAATNRPDLVDPALLRPGRFDKMLHVGACCDVQSKLGVFTALTRKFKLSDCVDLESLCHQLPDQVTGADLYSLCSNAWLSAARRSIKLIDQGISVDVPITVTNDDFTSVLCQLKPSVKPEDLAYYQQLKSLER